MGHFTQWQHTVCHPRQRDKTSRDIDKIVRYGRKKETPRHRQRQVHKRQPRALQEMHVPPLAPQTQNRPSRTGVVLDQALMWAAVDPWRRGPVEEMERKRRSLAHILARIGPSTVLLQLASPPSSPTCRPCMRCPPRISPRPSLQ